ncbi:MAG TPA: asparagine synthase (glutamine-hydrolyzing) [Candidatus Acidoferrales bacterium]|nr:asparagine synthase (glutamine-hydrolyzing) [Candidatus Acidoferrales bacterium]
MCGIAGFTHKYWCPQPERINNVIATLTHRGPDQQDVFRSGSCSIGAARLRIIDLEGGDQPITSADGKSVIALNGEIYNHRELRVELERRGRTFRTRTDTEVVLQAFLEWDTECFTRLRGMFAVAVWDEAAKRLVLARDRVGIKPLYIARRGGDIFFGSELKAILAHPEIDRRLCLAGLDCYLSLNYVPSPWTLVDGIEKLPPGHWLEWRDGEVRCEAYWSLPYGPARERTLDSAKEELDHLLRESVREHLISDVPLGIWLSGGIDSSTILHYAAQVSSSKLRTLSISFRGRSFDETPYIRQVAEKYGTDHDQFDLNPTENLVGAIEEFAYYSDEPTADAGALPLWFLSKMSKTRVTVTLSGEGGDEVFGGYLTYRANHLASVARKFPHGAIRLALAALRHWPVSDEKISFEYKFKRFLEGCLLPPEQAHIYWNGTFSKAQKTALLRSAPAGALDDLLREVRERALPDDDLASFLWFDQRYFLPDDILMKVDRMSMAHAVEVRPPFLDHRIVEFAATLPISFKIRGSRQKLLLRELMKKVLPESVLSRKKTGLDIPTHEWLRGPLRELMLDALNGGAAEHGGLFQKSTIDAHVRDHVERRANLGYHLWGMMILFLWMRKWRIQTVPIPTARPIAPEKVLSTI